MSSRNDSVEDRIWEQAATSAGHERSRLRSELFKALAPLFEVTNPSSIGHVPDKKILAACALVVCGDNPQSDYYDNDVDDLNSKRHSFYADKLRTAVLETAKQTLADLGRS